MSNFVANDFLTKKYYKKFNLKGTQLKMQYTNLITMLCLLELQIKYLEIQ